MDIISTSPGVNVLDSLSEPESYESLESKYLDPVNFLHEGYSKINYIIGFKTTLYQHQKTIVKAMLDFENIRFYNMTNIINNKSDIFKVTFNSAVLSEPVGSGKTIDILALICINKIPRIIPDIIRLNTKNSLFSVGFVRRKFKKIIKSTIIFVGVSVLSQWNDAINKFTNLTCFTVSNVKDLKNLFNLITSNKIDYYDIILIKNGKITVHIEMPEDIIKEEKNKVKQPYIYNIITNLRNYCWARVVIDDFDTIKLPSNASTPNGIFTWYISSTTKYMEKRIDRKINYNKASDWLKYHDYNASEVLDNGFLFNNLNLRNDDNFLQSAISMPCPKYHIILFNNPNDIYISLLNSMNTEEINQITEMINGDALKSAAEAVGISSSSVADIFGKILGSKYKEYRFAGDLLEFIDYQRENESVRMCIPKNVDLDEEDNEGTKVYRYGKTDLINFRDIEYKFPGVNKILDETGKEYKEIKNTNGIAIERVKNNIRHGNCSVCSTNLHEEKEIIIVKCCQAIFCGDCGIKSQNIINSNLKNGRCSNCRQTLNIRDLMYIGNEINITDIEEENFEDEDKETEFSSIDITKDKYTTIIDIIYNKNIKNSKLVDLYIPDMIRGNLQLEEAKIRKVLIFANYDETLCKVIKKLEEEKIYYWKLQGGCNEINRISKEFTNYEGTCALVINSTKHCSGLNLQTATDLIFSHVMYNKSVESQVVGRGHRLGRTSPLNIWYLLYENEYDTIKNTNHIRELDNE